MNQPIQKSFTIKIFDRKYEKYEIISLDNCEKRTETMDPIANKLFHNDVFTFGNQDPQIQNKKEPTIIKSPIREKPFFAGILVLNGNKTYGRKNGFVSMKKHEKLLYKCIPNDPFLPSFLVAYEMKTMGFSKLFHNLYVIFKYHNRNEY